MWLRWKDEENPATTNRANLFDPTNFVYVPTNDSAEIGLAFGTTNVLRLMNLSGTFGHVDRIDPKVLHNRNHLSHDRWLMHKVRSTRSLVVDKTTALVQFEIQFTIHP